MREEKGAFKYKVQKLGRGEELWLEEMGGSGWLIGEVGLLKSGGQSTK